MSTTVHYALAEGQATAIAGIHAEYVRALRDADEAAAGFDAGYYQGRADAFVGALSVLGAFQESTCAGCGKPLLFTADGRWLDDGDNDQCDPQPGWAKIPHTPTTSEEKS
jgi:hypothetical protein